MKVEKAGTALEDKQSLKVKFNIKLMSNRKSLH